MAIAQSPQHRQKPSLFILLTSLLFVLQLGPFTAASNASHGFHHTGLEKRIDDRAWQKAVNSGNALYCLMSRTIEGAEAYMHSYKPGVNVESPWTDFGDLGTWGWVRSTEIQYPEPSYDDVLDNYLTKNLGVDPDDGIPIEYRQSVEVTINGIVYRASKARMANVFFPNDGLIVADENFGPKHSAKWIAEQNLHYVKLQQWSDIAFLIWQKQCSEAGTSMQSLENVIRFSVVNSEAEDIIQHVSSGRQIGGFSKALTFRPGEVEFNALLGSPNGSGVAWLLINHKTQLGIKRVSSISLFKARDPLGVGTTINMAFTIENVTP